MELATAANDGIAESAEHDLILEKTVGKYDVDAAILDALAELPRLPKPNLWHFANFAARLEDAGSFVEQLCRITGTVGLKLTDSRTDIDAAVATAEALDYELSLLILPYDLHSGDPSLVGRSAISAFVREHLASLRKLLGNFADLPIRYVSLSCEKWPGESVRSDHERTNRHIRYEEATSIVRRQFPDATIGWYHYAPQFTVPGRRQIWGILFDQPKVQTAMLGDVQMPEMYVPWQYSLQEQILRLALDFKALVGSRVRPVISLIGQYTPPSGSFDEYTLPQRRAGWSWDPPTYPGYYGYCHYQGGMMLHNWPLWNGGKGEDRIEAVLHYGVPPYLSDPPAGYPNRWAEAFAYYVCGASKLPTDRLEGLAAWRSR